jgi:hypothetical protein
MADKRFEDPDTIGAVVDTSSRLKYLLTSTYGIGLDEIEAIRVDGDNFKIDVHAAGQMLRFKAKGLDHVLAKNPESGALELKLDPALAQAIYNIVDDFAAG